jgi:hypothetical protein
VTNVSESILNGTKKILGIEESYTAFDADVLMHINSIFSVLNQLGIGPDNGFAIEDASSTWDDYLDGDLRLNSIKSYVYLRVRILFDPPMTAYLVTAMKEQIQELEWRLNVQREGESWTDPSEIV